MAAIQTYSEENQKFTEKGIKASATRARKALAELGKPNTEQEHILDIAQGRVGISSELSV